jgi:S1-C subfamily serine protease
MTPMLKPFLLPAMVLLGLFIGSGVPSVDSYTPSLLHTLDATSGVNSVTVDANDLAWINASKASTVAVFTPEGGLGSGVVVDRCCADAYVLTARHVVEDQHNQPMYNFILRYGIGDADVALQGTLVRMSKDVDLALIKANDPTGLLRVAPFAKALPAKGDLVFALGYPAGAYPTIVSVGFYIESEFNIDDCREYLYHTAGIWFGNSGGKLVNRQGELIGINVMVGVYNDHVASDRGMAVPLHSILAFLGEK